MYYPHLTLERVLWYNDIFWTQRYKTWMSPLWWGDRMAWVEPKPPQCLEEFFDLYSYMSPNLCRGYKLSHMLHWHQKWLHCVHWAWLSSRCTPGRVDFLLVFLFLFHRCVVSMCACMFVCVWSHVCVSAYTFGYAWMQRPQIDFGNHPKWPLLPHSLRQGLLIKLRIHWYD